MPREEITTIKLNKKTKQRLNKLKVHNRETYEEILQKMLNILNTCRADPGKAQDKLIEIERDVRRVRGNKQGRGD